MPKTENALFRLLTACLVSAVFYATPGLTQEDLLPPASPEDAKLQPEPTTITETGPILDEKRAGALALQTHGGELLSIQLIQTENSPHYRIKLLLDDSRINVVKVDALSGEVK